MQNARLTRYFCKILLIAPLFGCFIFLMKKNTKAKRIYMAGSLFCGREIFGNAALADEIENFSGNAYVCELPQSYEPRSNAPKAVRDCDYTHLLQCDAVLAAFDGLELDSGTVAEFITAKVADKPAILLRSDFRISGDQVSGGDPWNLMCSFYPRSTVLHFNFMQAYKDYLKESKNALAAANLANKELAKLCVKALDKLFKTRPILSKSEIQNANKLIKKVFDIK